ncbi:MAG: hypothetical protein ACRDQU_01590 [Pseudonocardiaceae bacterium]
MQRATRQAMTRQAPVMATRMHGAPVHRAAQDANKPKRVPEDIDGGQRIETVDSPPSPADVPDDMEYDPGGEGTPGVVTPPVPAPVPGDEDSEVKKDNGMDYLLPLGGDDSD